MHIILLLLVLGLFACWHVLKIFKNWNLARKIGLPIYICPIDGQSKLWSIIFYQLNPVIERLPLCIRGRLEISRHGWIYKEKLLRHQELGKVYIQVTPAAVEIQIADAAVAHYVLSNRNKFLKPVLLERLNLFGKNIATVQGIDWQRHRKITSTTFNERKMEAVWNEAHRQAKGMLEFWDLQRQTGVASVAEDTSTLALHVLTCAAFGTSYNFQTRPGDSTKDNSIELKNSLKTILTGFIMGGRSLNVLKLIWPFKTAPKPEELEYPRAVDDFKQYMSVMLTAEKLRISQDMDRKGNLIEALAISSVEASSDSDYLKPIDGIQPTKVGVLTDSEIFGNIFMFHFAGYETTSLTLAYSIYLLAAFPEWQKWVIEEIDLVVALQPDLENLNYKEIFALLKRCLAIMMETLRLYGPVVRIPQITKDLYQTIELEDRSITIPPHSRVYCNSMSLHTHPDYWGSNALSWLPGRWVKPSLHNSDSASASTKPVKEEMFHPPKGTYMPWAEGPRNCPGKRFSQVEFVSVIFTLFRRHRVEIVPVVGESVEDSRRRVLAVVQDSVIRLTLQMKRPQSVQLRWITR